MTSLKKRNIKVENYDEDGRTLCGAELIGKEGYCSNPCGWRTSHPGIGRCIWHENTINGVKNFTKFKIPAIEERLNDFLNDDDILNLDNEIAINRAYLELCKSYIKVLSDENLRNVLPENSKISLPQLTDTVVRVTANIGKLVRTKSELEVGRKYVVHINVFQSIISQVAEIVDSQIVDVEVKKNILKQFGSINLPSPE